MSGPVLHIDYETFSECDLRASGAYAYAMHPSTDILCAAWRIDDGPVRLWVPGEPVPALLRHADQHIDHEPSLRIVAHNASFERLIWKHVACRRYGWPEVPDEAFWCTAAQAANLGLPRDLDGAGGALGATQRKDPTGRRVMLKLSQPRRPTKNDDRTRWTPEMAPDDFAHLYRYCVDDVEAECSIGGLMRPLSAREREIYLLDARINDRGVKIDRALILASKRVVEQEMTRLDLAMARTTVGAVRACTQVAKLVEWLQGQGVDTESVAKADLSDLLAGELPDTARDALLLRQEAAKSSTAKLNAMLAAACPDDRIRGSLLYYGAQRTGRWAGRLHQPQNYPRGEKWITKQTAAAVAALMTGDADVVRLTIGPPLDVVSSCLRPCMIAEEGHDLMCPDFSNIEGRGLAWLAGEEWKLQAFRDFDAGTGPDLYLLGASRILGKPVADVTEDERQSRGKVPELACGYQGWVGAFQAMAKLYGLTIADEDAATWAGAWRDAHPCTRRFWYDLNDAALAAVANPGVTRTVRAISFRRQDGWLWCRLPSGRVLAYCNPSIAKNDRGEDAVHFWGVPNPAKPIPQDGVSTRRWAKLSTYGGGLAENVTQAMCRDILAEAMLRLEANGYRAVLTVHDEIVLEAPHGFGSPAEVTQIVSEVPAWCQGMPISVGKVSRAKRYAK